MKARVCCPKCHGQDVLLLRNVVIGNPVGFAEVEILNNKTRKIEFDYDDEKMSMMDEIDGEAGFYCRECGETFESPEILYLPTDNTPLQAHVFYWQGHKFQSSSVKTPEFKKFASELRTAIKKELPDYIELAEFNIGHFYISGFCRNKTTEEFAYFNFSDVRYFPDGWVNDVLVRRCDGLNDYTGGKNNSVKLTLLVNKIIELTGGKNE